MKVVNQSNGELSIVTLDSYDEFTTLDPWVYKNPTYNEGSGALTLTKSESLYDVPEKIYGNTDRLADAIMNDYRADGDVLGALLVGKKGMGKSLLAEKMSLKMIDKGIPVIHVTRAVSAVALDKAIEVLAPCVLYLEEFEKCFVDPQDVPIFLNMFSSTTIKGLMVIIAANSINNIMYDPLLDRPQRLRFRINYNEIDDATVDEILSDTEVSKRQKDVYREWVKSSKPNIDSLITLVKLTRHLTDPEELVEYISILNVPKLNDLRYKLSAFTLTGWNYPALANYNYTVKLTSVLEPAVFNVEMDGEVKLTGKVDLTVDGKNKRNFSTEITMESGKGEEAARITALMEFELCRDGGDIPFVLTMPLNQEYRAPLPLIANGKVVSGNSKDVSRFVFI